MIPPSEQREIEDFAQKLAQGIGQLVKERFGGRIFFTLVVGTFGADGWMTYVSSGNRVDMIQTLRELAAKVEADPRKKPREYVRSVDAPQRFDLQRVEEAVLEGRSLQVPEVPGGGSLLVTANGRLAGVLVLSEAEERALKARLYREEEG